MIGRILGALGVPVLIVGLIWLGAVIYFQQVGGDITSADIVTWFALVPLAAVVVWFVGKALCARSQRPAETAADSTAQSTETPVEKDGKLALRLTVLSAEINTAAGESAPDIVQAIRKGSIQPGFAEHLVNANGMPVKAVCHEQLDSEEHLPWVEKWLSSTSNADEHSAEEGARLLALLQAPLARTLDVLGNLPPLPDDGATSRKGNHEKALRPLVTKVFAPPAWEDMLTAYIRTQVMQGGGFAFGVVRVDAERPELQADAVRVADAFCKASTDVHSNSILMIVACDSLTAQTQIDALEANGLLFTSANQAGLIPGEAAAVFLAAPSTLFSTLATDEAPPLASLHRAAFGARQKPVDASGRSDATHLQELSSATLSNAALEAISVAGLVSDCDHRSPWLTEAAMLLNASFTELDPVADHIALGNALGSTGHASNTLALALAAHAIAIDEKPLLAASLSDRRSRSVVALSPWQALAPNTPATPNLS
ncbi:MAG TPA: hypothetical protein VLC92_00120 [Rhodocyclaceae bacterium]|nr:hypothetical protein [Rhodocyclaceae bacterium]